jgi:hypothetical protein
MFLHDDQDFAEEDANIETNDIPAPDNLVCLICHKFIGTQSKLIESTKFTNPLFIVKHSRLPSSQWDEPIGTGSRQLAVYEGNTRHRLEEPGNSQERLTNQEETNSPGPGDHPEETSAKIVSHKQLS